MMEGGRTEGQAAVFKKGQESEGGRERVASIICFKCGKLGHKAYECGVEENGFSLPASGVSSTPRKITCFLCGIEGHKSTQCPNRNKMVKTEPYLGKNIKAEPKEVPARQVNRIRGHPSRDTVLEMTVNGQAVPVLLDSGSAITVVPETMVAQAQQTGGMVELRGFAAKETLVLPLAEIPFEIDDLYWKETVALSPAEAGREVVYGLDLVSSRGLKLVYLANRHQLDKEVNTGGGKLAADRPASGPAPIVNELEKIEEQKEEVGFLVEEEEEEEVEERVYSLRRLEVVDCSKDFSESEPCVVGGDQKRLEASLHPNDVSKFDFCAQFCSSSESEQDVDSEEQLRGVSPHRRKHRGESSQNSFLEQPQEQPRTVSVLVVGGDVGTAHRRRKKEKEKEKEEDKEQERENKDPFM